LVGDVHPLIRGFAPFRHTFPTFLGDMKTQGRKPSFFMKIFFKSPSAPEMDWFLALTQSPHRTMLMEMSKKYMVLIGYIVPNHQTSSCGGALRTADYVLKRWVTPGWIISSYLISPYMVRSLEFCVQLASFLDANKSCPSLKLHHIIVRCGLGPLSSITLTKWLKT
jgi:hypothetical protein